MGMFYVPLVSIYGILAINSLAVLQPWCLRVSLLLASNHRKIITIIKIVVDERSIAIKEFIGLYEIYC